MVNSLACLMYVIEIPVLDSTSKLIESTSYNLIKTVIGEKIDGKWNLVDCVKKFFNNVYWTLST